MTEPTTERLAKRLEHQLAIVTDPATRRTLTLMIEKAREGYYDDYKSPLVAPIGQLVEHCQRLGFDDIADEAITGAFDATKEEAEAWLASEEGQATMAEVWPALRLKFGDGRG